jgi:DNA-binding transcriptional LysR family regulator
MRSINIRTFDLNLLRIFVEIDRTRSVSRAGAHLGLSQPASSNALARLRQSLGDPLFVRAKTGMVPTPYAAAILPDIKRYLSGIFDTLGQQNGFNPDTSDRIFALSTSGLGEVIFLPQLALRTLTLAPNIKIKNLSTPLSDLSTSLEKRETDLAIGMISTSGRAIRSTKLFDDYYVAIAGVGLAHRLRNLRDLQTAKLIVPTPAATYATDIEDTLDRNGLTENVILRLAHFGAMPQLLRQLDAAAIVPLQYGRDLQEAGLAKILDIQLDQETKSINMVWHASSDTDAACIWIRNQVIELFSTQDPSGQAPYR